MVTDKTKLPQLIKGWRGCAFALIGEMKQLETLQ